MGSEFYLITGTSRGIGEALARKLLAEGHRVLGLSRSRPGALVSERYHHLSFDLSDTSRISQVMEEVDRIFDGQHFDFVCLVNNASATEPVGPIETCPAGEIEAHIRIGLVAPMILTSLFMRRFAAGKMRKKVAFISSGAAFRPMPDESAYCGAKAGLHMFAQCVGLEQGERDHAFELISIGPGMVDTAMQQAVRSKSSDEFALAGFFKQAFEDGRLQDPAEVAEKICGILANRYEQGRYVAVSDV
jgi:benzil reductase ((S)-benzoin forming)